MNSVPNGLNAHRLVPKRLIAFAFSPVNNLGEAPQDKSMYMPECWLKDRANEVVVFDLYGQNPAGLKLIRYDSLTLPRPD